MDITQAITTDMTSYLLIVLISILISSSLQDDLEESSNISSDYFEYEMLDFSEALEDLIGQYEEQISEECSYELCISMLTSYDFSEYDYDLCYGLCFQAWWNNYEDQYQGNLKENVT